MSLGKLWAGRVYGTNTGNLFVKLVGEDAALSGTLHFNDPMYGMTVYVVSASFDGATLKITGDPQPTDGEVILGHLDAIANLTPKGELKGEWKTDVGSAGTFILFPHNRSEELGRQSEYPDQLHTARHSFGAIEIARGEIVSIADEIQKRFDQAKVVITVISDTEQARYLDDFRAMNFSSDRVESIKIFAQQPESGGINRVVSIEFGPHTNAVMTQSSDEAWALGTRETLKRDLQKFERSYTTNFRYLGIGVNQLLLLWGFIYLPSLESLFERITFISAILLIIFGVSLFHRKYLPHAAIFLGKKKESLLAKIGPTLISWFVALTAAIAAALTTLYLKSLFNIDLGT